jgi:hypothetical protein
MNINICVRKEKCVRKSHMSLGHNGLLYLRVVNELINGNFPRQKLSFSGEKYGCR